MRFCCRLTFFLLCLFQFGAASARDAQVRNVTFEPRGDDIFIRYTLLGNASEKFRVALSLSDDYGQSFELKPFSVEGDIGQGITPGGGKQIVWRMKRDYPSGLDGEGYVFAVDATLQKGGTKWKYFVGAAIAVGVGYYFYSSQGDATEEEATTGSLSIEVSNQVQD